MPAIRLQETHPNLFWSVFFMSLTHFSVGCLMLYAVIRLGPRNPAMATLFISAFFAVGGMGMYGLFRPNFVWVQRSLMAGLFLIGFLALVFAGSIGRTLNSEQTIRLAWVFPPWGLWAGMHLLALREPPVNPVTEIKKK